MDEIISRWGGALPSALQVEITSRCNLHCKMCPLTTEGTGSSLKAGHLSEILWEDLVPLAREVGLVIISGYGEPLTNPRCLALLRQLDSHGVNMGMATNGTALSPRICTELAQLSHLIHINISIDSPDPSPLKLVVENCGTLTWTQKDMIKIGTSKPRDHYAACAHPTWLSKERITSFLEASVPPGAKAKFLFQINPLPEGEREFFQLVVEEKCWLPYTHFSIGSESRARLPAPAMVGQ